MKFCRFPLIGIAAAIALFLCGCEEMPSRSNKQSQLCRHHPAGGTMTAHMVHPGLWFT
jgi:hypothetical protein